MPTPGTGDGAAGRRHTLPRGFRKLLAHGVEERQVLLAGGTPCRAGTAHTASPKSRCKALQSRCGRSSPAAIRVASPQAGLRREENGQTDCVHIVLIKPYNSEKNKQALKTAGWGRGRLWREEGPGALACSAPGGRRCAGPHPHCRPWAGPRFAQPPDPRGQPELIPPLRRKRPLRPSLTLGARKHSSQVSCVLAVCGAHSARVLPPGGAGRAGGLWGRISKDRN